MEKLVLEELAMSPPIVKLPPEIVILLAVTAPWLVTLNTLPDPNEIPIHSGTFTISRYNINF